MVIGAEGIAADLIESYRAGLAVEPENPQALVAGDRTVARRSRVGRVAAERLPQARRRFRPRQVRGTHARRASTGDGRRRLKRDRFRAAHSWRSRQSPSALNSRYCFRYRAALPQAWLCPRQQPPPNVGKVAHDHVKATCDHEQAIGQRFLQAADEGDRGQRRQHRTKGNNPENGHHNARKPSALPNPQARKSPATRRAPSRRICRLQNSTKPNGYAPTTRRVRPGKQPKAPRFADRAPA